jgi:hypothetical protein
MLDSLRATEPELINFRPPTIQADAVNN